MAVLIASLNFYPGLYCSSHVLDEAERSLHDALCVLASTVKDCRVVWGGGWPEMLMAQQVDELARKTPGKKSIAIEAFGTALRAIPSIISDNAGLDSADLVSKLRAAHFNTDSRAGIDVITGTVRVLTPSVTLHPDQLPIAYRNGKLHDTKLPVMQLAL